MDIKKYYTLSEEINDAIFNHLKKDNTQEGLENTITVLINKLSSLIAMHLIKIIKVKKFTTVEQVAQDFAELVKKEIKSKYQQSMIQEL